MPIIQKSALPLNLDKYRVWAIDTAPDSVYFRVSQIPEVLSAGKNAFLINGSNELVASTDVLVELKDSNGNTIFTQPIRNYAEGLARVVSIEVYEDTPPGPATLTIMGQLRQDIRGVLPPEDFRNSYNVKWTKRIMVDPFRLPDTVIRTYNKPEISVVERLAQVKEETGSIRIITSGTLATVPYTFRGNMNRVLYAIQIRDNTNDKFEIEAVGGTVQLVIAGTPVTASIARVLNDTTVLVSASLGEDASFSVETTNQFIVQYTGSSMFNATNYYRSYADITYTKLPAFSGQLYRSKVLMRDTDSEDTTGFVLIDDAVLQPVDLLQRQSSVGELISAGNIKNQSILDYYWTVGTFENGMTAYLGDNV